MPRRLEASLTIWLVIAITGAATVLLKAAGPVFLGERTLPARALDLIVLLAPALLAALVVTQTLGGGHAIMVDARLPGVAAAAVAIRLRAPLLAVIVLAALVTGLARALT